MFFDEKGSKFPTTKKYFLKVPFSKIAKIAKCKLQRIFVNHVYNCKVDKLFGMRSVARQINKRKQKRISIKIYFLQHNHGQEDGPGV